MGQWKLLNSTDVPINMGMSWGGVSQTFRNEIKPGDSVSWTVNGIGGHDLFIMMSTPETRIEPHKFREILNWVIGGAGLVIAVGGAVAAVVATGGTAAVVIGGVIAFGGVTVTVSDIILAMSDRLHPVKVTDLYGPHNYDLQVTGGKAETEIEDSGDENVVIRIIKVGKMRMHWKNNTIGTSGTV